ncbi:MAG: protein kinase [Deltaproteobacteria bacterium]|nr:protein kinase [Deltaproteobacteria bacterium]
MAGPSLSSLWITGEENGFPRPFGSYLLLAAFAQGGMGELMLAMNGSIAGAFRLCVVKKLRADLTNDKEYVNRFVDEAKVVVQLNHANISHVFDIGRIEGQYYLAMEYVSGISVKRLMARAAELGTIIPEDIALYIARGVLDALDYAHQHTHPISGEALHVVHRDVSPQNVLVSWGGEVKLIDFGLALSVMKDEHTATGAVMGKVAYMPPEQARGDEVGPACDQFAAAIVTYEMLVGERYHGDLPMHAIWAIAGMGNFPPPKWSKLPREIQIILQRALHNDPFRRYPTCGDLRDVLGAYMAAHHPATSGKQLRDLLDGWFKDYRAEERELLAKFRDVTGSKIREAVKGSVEAESLISGTHQRPQGWQMPPTDADARAISGSGPASQAPQSAAALNPGPGGAPASLPIGRPDDSRSMRLMPPPTLGGPVPDLAGAAAELLAPPPTASGPILAPPAPSTFEPHVQAAATAPAKAPAHSRQAASVASAAASVPRSRVDLHEPTERLRRTDGGDDELEFDPALHRPMWPWAIVAGAAVVVVVIAIALSSRGPDAGAALAPQTPPVDVAAALPGGGTPPSGATPTDATTDAGAPVVAIELPPVVAPPATGSGTGKTTKPPKLPRDRGEKPTTTTGPAPVDTAPPPGEHREAERARERVDALRRSACKDPCVARIVGQLETMPGAVELDGFRKSVGACVDACL